MVRYVFSKLGYGLLVLWGVVTIVFFIFTLGGDPVENLVAENATQEVKDAIRQKYNLDLPIYQQYFRYLNDLSPAGVYSSDSTSRYFADPQLYAIGASVNIGGGAVVFKAPYLNRSYVSDRSVSAIIRDAMPGTIVLAILAMGLAIVLGMAIGIGSALNKDTILDHTALVLSVLGMSGPSFFMAILLAWLGGYVWYEVLTIPAWPVVFLLLFVCSRWFWNRRHKAKWSAGMGTSAVVGIGVGMVAWGVSLIFGVGEWYMHFPGTGLNMTGSLYDVDVWKGEILQPRNLILPVLTLGIRPLAVIVQLTRNSLLEVMEQPFIRTARAKGLPERAILVRHALPNALNPVITAISGWFASMLAGAVFVEFVFGWKGLGLETYNALENDDLPVVMGAVVVIAATFVVINLLTDILYSVIDPRVRLD
ncbi:MAG: ABC transporter permease [Flavobacteriales bacterium]|nr:ABC transporter permease [Flavobacteriales bacterium]